MRDMKWPNRIKKKEYFSQRQESTMAQHLRFKQAQPKMCHSPKVDDGVAIFLKTS